MINPLCSEMSFEGEQVNARVVKETPLSISDVEKNVRAFLERRYVAENLSVEDYARLHGLQEALLEQKAAAKKKKVKQKRSISSEAVSEEPDRKKRRRRCVT